METTMRQAKTHTPLPWHLDWPDFDQAFDDFHERDEGDGILESSCAKISAPDGKWRDFARVVVVVQGDKDEEGVANAEFIFRACSAHYDLVAALQFVEKFAAMRASKGDPLPWQLVDAVTAALAQATTTTKERT